MRSVQRDFILDVCTGKVPLAQVLEVADSLAVSLEETGTCSDLPDDPG